MLPLSLIFLSTSIVKMHERYFISFKFDIICSKIISMRELSSLGTSNKNLKQHFLFMLTSDVWVLFFFLLILTLVL